MKIAIDCRLWNEGGVGRYIRNLVWQLEKIDRKNQYTLFFYQTLPNQIPSRFETKITQAKWHSLLEQTLFVSELNLGNFDLVHFPYFSHPILYQRPFVITLHDLTVKHFSTGKATTKGWFIYQIKRMGYHLVLNHAVKQAKQILVPSQTVLNDVVDFFPKTKNKLTVTYEGLGLDLVQAKPAKVVIPARNFWLYVGNFYPHKNVNLLLQTMKDLGQNSQHLVMVGPNDLFAKRLRAHINQLKISGKVTLLSEITNDQLAWLYQQALGLVLPSLYEGFGLPILEAAYFGCPMYLADTAVFKEIAPKGAKFFNPHSASSLKQFLFKTTKRQTLLISPSYWQRFSFAKMAKQTLAVYQQSL